ncbi:hypothetical protein [Niabella hibiscisoli]|uniref:hypothetical protein n=1 Tax=Niabella hibiscisoli TaxID=1825928 RepID=UPI001F0E35BB|nr:hypothetical protein [Niabella hibiscisoli]MCH5719583.1 hypothetical protein [Niabella hibiscisoli]
MRSELNYEQVLRTMRLSDSDEIVQQGTLLLTMVHELMQKDCLTKHDFSFTQFDEGHILITWVNPGNHTTAVPPSFKP